MDFTKLSSSKRQTKLSEKAQASAPPKKGRLVKGAPSNPHTPTTSISKPLTSSLGSLGDATNATPPVDPSDHDTRSSTREVTGEVDGGAEHGTVIDIDDSENEKEKEQWVDKPESPEDELSQLSIYRGKDS